MGVLAILYSRELYVESVALALIACIIIGVILTDTGSNKVSIRGTRIKREKPDNPSGGSKDKE